MGLGFDVDVVIVKDHLSEIEALSLEMERIKERRYSGTNLCNLTDGGEGVSGYKHSDETRSKLSLAHKGRKKPEHSRRLIGRKDSDETRSRKAVSAKGRVFSPETRAKLARARTGKSASEQTKKRLRESHAGKVHSVETKLKMKRSQEAAWKDRDKERHRNAVTKALSDPVVIEKMRSKAVARNSSPEARERAREYAFRRWRPSPS